MQCEMCGQEIRGSYRTIHIEGAELRVCQRCARYGTEVGPKQQTSAAARPGGRSPAPTPPRRRKRDVFDLMEGEIAEDCGERVHAARKAQGMTARELADSIKEKELLIRKIEKGKLIPEDDVRKKLEKVLCISLLEEGPGAESSGGGESMTTTFGDLIKIRRPR
ncbi:MAG: multiprotein bridging factor aMBF1 [Methanomicrobiales archaeon]